MIPININEIVLLAIIGFCLGSLLVTIVMNTVRRLDRSNRIVSKWLNRWILCPNHFGDPLGAIIKSWILEYPHDFCMENNKVICQKCGFKGLYLRGGIYDREGSD